MIYSAAKGNYYNAITFLSIPIMLLIGCLTMKMYTL